MLPSDAANDALWAILLGHLQDLGSDDVVRVVNTAGLNVDWTLTQQENYSHRTRLRAYVPRVQAAYNLLQNEHKRRVLASLAATLVRLHPRSDELQTALAAVEAPAPENTRAAAMQENIIPQVTADPRSVFVVHGRDDNLRASLFELLTEFGLQPIEWSEAVRLTGQGSPYIGDILDAAFAHAQAIVVLLSPDDEVRLAPALQREGDGDSERRFTMQARPNVLFEAGLGFGRNPDRTILVEVGAVKAFSDIAGRHVVRLTNDEARRRDLANRLSTAGCAVSLEGDRWQHAGNFSVARAAEHRAASQQRVAAPAPPVVRWVDLNYPHDTGLQASLESDGYLVRWTFDAVLARRLDLEGWSLVTREIDGQSVIFKMRDAPDNQTLVKKRNVLDRQE